MANHDVDSTAVAGGADMPATARLVQMLHGKLVAQAICAVAELGVADHLAAEPRSAASLAQATGAHTASLYRLLRLLASVGIFEEADDRTFKHTPLSSALKRDVPGSVHGIACMVGAEWHAVAETKIVHSVRTGETAFRLVHGKPVFDYLQENPAAGSIFDAAMTGLSQAVNHSLSGAYDFSRARSVVDVGGGQGSLLTTILQSHPSLQGTVFDSHAVVAGAVKQIEAAGLRERCRAIGGDFFAAVPPNADIYVLKYILHDWNDESALAILRSCRVAAAAHSRLLIVEDLVGDPNAPSSAKLTDIEMLMIFGGRERTQAEYAELLKKAGFALERTIPTGLPVFVLEAVPI
jgi:hypothetical protein